MTLADFVKLVQLDYTQKIWVCDYWKTDEYEQCIEYGYFDLIHGFSNIDPGVENRCVKFFTLSPSNRDMYVFID